MEEQFAEYINMNNNMDDAESKEIEKKNLKVFRSPVKHLIRPKVVSRVRSNPPVSEFKRGPVIHNAIHSLILRCPEQDSKLAAFTPLLRPLKSSKTLWGGSDSQRQTVLKSKMTGTTLLP